MGLSHSRPPNDGVYAHLRDQTRLIADLQTYLNRVDKLLADSETAHKGVRRAVESFFPADAPSHDVVFRLMQSMKVFEQVRLNLRSQTNSARRTFQTLLDRAQHLERLVKERDKLSRKVEAYEKNLEKLRSKYSVSPTPALQKRLAKAEGRFNTVHRQFELKDVETQFEASGAMDGRYAEAATVISQCALIIIQYVQMTAPEMEKANNLLVLLQQTTGGLQTTPFRPLTDAPTPPPVYISQQAEHQSNGAEPLGDACQSLYQANQQPPIPVSFSKRTECSVGGRRIGEASENANRQALPMEPTTTRSPDVPHRIGVATEKDNFGAPGVESSGQTPVIGGSLPSNPFENDL